jgi:hypothetical protein
MRYMPRPSHYSRIYHPHNAGWGVKIIKLLIMKFYSLYLYESPVTPSLLGPNILLNTLFSNSLNLRSFLYVSDQVSHYTKQREKLWLTLHIALN